METLGILLAALILLGMPIASSAQEVDLVRFAPTTDAQPGSPLVVSISQFDPNATVSESMQAHLQTEPSLSSAATLVPYANPSALVRSGLSQRANSLRYRTEACDDVVYAPTWWLSRSVEIRRARYFRVMANIACEHGLPIRLFDAVIAQESGYKSWAVSTAGAMGLMQIMPGTARFLKLASPFDPISNMRAGARYLREQLDRFGRVDLALAAYNAGPERSALKRGQVPAIPETLQYIRTITTNWTRLLQIGEFSEEPINREQVALTTLRVAGYREVEFIRYDGLNAANPM